MDFFSIFLIGVGLSMDAFAVSLTKGLQMNKIDYKGAGIIALFFGGFQALMPAVGWLLGTRFEKYVVTYDHWIAFGLLAYIGGKMLYDGIKGERDDTARDGKIIDFKELLVLAVATSIDALAVGISFAFLSINIVSSITIIGITTFIISFVGVLIGHSVGLKFKDKATILGGAILIFIGAKILLEHLGIIG